MRYLKYDKRTMLTHVAISLGLGSLILFIYFMALLIERMIKNKK